MLPPVDNIHKGNFLSIPSSIGASAVDIGVDKRLILFTDIKGRSKP